ncbi:FAD-dependent monooxygenase [Allokutzneria sp. A3M-2-11 16]|uniref:FAD-dependent monooxygenase n=1 Tax=Allokutzneria sp. A3M-2-11 16 TaxID=2962043 RepID=UPI0020B82FC7|nr:FAD-dependent monooxygenase [Allokutzneria sp. A3M-2-11 16]MCP3800646.1 FAD-dependent monooxygenase [Allokutzneria sp. A3M-2-11 16]
MKAVIIGGGIAGTVAAIALHKAGIDAVVHEAYPTGADDAGAFFTIMHNGMNALAAVGLDQVVAEHSYPARGVRLLTGAGREVSAQTYSQGPRTLRRAALYQVLHAEAAKRGIRVEHNKRLVAATEQDGVVATFADGSTAEGDVLIAADGTHSTARAIINPGAPRARYTGLNVVYGYAPAREGEEPNTYTFVHGARAAFGYIGVPHGQTWWFSRLPGPELDLTGMTPQQWKDHASAYFADDDFPAVEIIQSTDGEVIGSNVYDIPTTPNWHTERMVLAGDAAHAASPAAGQGASMALEDAVTLAKCLRDLPPDKGFPVYERLRRDRVERLVANSAARDATRTGGAPQPPMSEAELAEVTRRRQAYQAWLYEHHIDWAETVS